MEKNKTELIKPQHDVQIDDVLLRRQRNDE